MTSRLSPPWSPGRSLDVGGSRLPHHTDREPAQQPSSPADLSQISDIDLAVQDVPAAVEFCATRRGVSLDVEANHEVRGQAGLAYGHAPPDRLNPSVRGLAGPFWGT
jgi:hypothetical protein